MDEENKQDFMVEDKRVFDKNGNIRESASEKPAEAKSGEKPKTRKRSTAQPDSENAGKAEKIDFISLLFSYVHTALIHLGDVEDPIQHKTSENLEGARQMIDVLELIQEKTKGNLDQREGQYLESALFDLRMRYMQKAKLIK